MQYKAHTIGSAEFANGTKFRIDQVKASGACRIIDTVHGTIKNYTHDITAAWRSVRYQARVIDRTERTVQQETLPLL